MTHARAKIEGKRSVASVVERRSLAGELSPSHARLAADGRPLWVNRPLQVSQPGQLSLSSFRGRKMSSELDSDVCQRYLVKATKVTASLAESNGSLLPGGGCHLWADCLYNGISITALKVVSRLLLYSAESLYTRSVSCRVPASQRCHLATGDHTRRSERSETATDQSAINQQRTGQKHSA